MDTTTSTSPCTHCPLRSTCTTPCEKLEALLPPDQEPRVALYPRTEMRRLIGIERRCRDVRRLLDHRDILTSMQAYVFDLRFNLGLTWAQAADHSGMPVTNLRATMARAIGRIRRKRRDIVREAWQRTLEEERQERLGVR